MMGLVFPKGRLMGLYRWNRQPFVCARVLVIVSYAMRHVANALAETSHWQTIGKYWNTTIQQNNIWSLAFEALLGVVLSSGNDT